MSYVTVLGAGAWGTTIAGLLADKGYDTTLWAFEPEVAEDIQKTGINSAFLPGHVLPKTLRVTSEMSEAFHKTRYVVCVVPTQHTRSILAKAISHLGEEAVLISASKGIENKSLKTVSEIIVEVTGRQVAALSGPSFASEVAKRMPTAVTLAYKDNATALKLQELFTTDYFRVYTHHDVIGAELGGALKNVMAVASGICEGMGLGNNARAALITRGLAEMTRLGKAMGGDVQTFSGLSGLGDLVLTCSSPLSRNFTVGVKLGQGMRLSDIMAGTRSVAEGVHTASAAYELARSKGVEMPIVEQIYKVVHEDKPAASAVADLMGRSLKPEFHGLRPS